MRTPLALTALFLAASCVAPPRQAPVPPARVVAPPPPGAPIARPTDWRDWQQSAGDWRYAAVPGGSAARFGGVEPLASLRCDDATRTVILAIAPSFPGLARQTATVRTTSFTRAVALAPDPAGGSAARIAASDPLLDAIGFSRGRFVVETAGTEPLVLPAWPEVERVVEDCRR